MDRGVRGVANTINDTLKHAIVGAFGIYAIERATMATIEYGSEITDTASRLGVSAEKLQEFNYAAQQNGATVADVTTALEKMGVARDEALEGGTQQAEDLVASFKRLGVSLDDLKSKRADELLGIIGATVKAGDPQQLIGPLRDVAGRSAGNLVAAFKDGLDEMARQAREKGLIMSDEVGESLKNIGDRFTDLKFTLLVGLSPAIVWVIDRFYDLADAIKIAGAWVGGFVGQLGSISDKGGGAIGEKGIVGDAMDAAGKFTDDNLSRERRTNALEMTKQIFQEAKSEKDEFFKKRTGYVQEIAKKFGEASVAADEAAREAIDEVATRRAERNAKKPAEFGSRSEFGFDSGRTEKAKSIRHTPESDSLVAVGNFLGKSRDVVAQIAKQQLDVSKESLVVHRQQLNVLSQVLGQGSIFPP